MQKLPWYEYLIPVIWAGLILLGGYASSKDSQSLAYGLLGGLVVFSVALIWLRRNQWRNQAWQGTVKAKHRCGPGFLPLFRSPYELVVTQSAAGDLSARVNRRIYNGVQVGEAVRKNPGDENVYIG